jgi:ribose-phosphate pyrophosphokinase
VENLNQTFISEIVVTNTVHLPVEKQFPQLKSLSVASLFARAIKHIHTGESVSGLF